MANNTPTIRDLTWSPNGMVGPFLTDAGTDSEHVNAPESTVDEDE
jgi:hypothetical protein